jgi:hypothetical protein
MEFVFGVAKLLATTSFSAPPNEPHHGRLIMPKSYIKEKRGQNCLLIVLTPFCSDPFVLTATGQQPMTLHWLRMMLSVGCGTVAVLMCLLCIRSYWWAESVEGNVAGWRVVAISGHGVAQIQLAKTAFGSKRSYYWSESDASASLAKPFNVPFSRYGLPYWAIVTISASIALSAWKGWRFLWGVHVVAGLGLAMVLGQVFFPVR